MQTNSLIKNSLLLLIVLISKITLTQSIGNNPIFDAISYAGKKMYGKAEQELLSITLNDKDYELGGYYLTEIYRIQQKYGDAMATATKFAQNKMGKDRATFYKLAGIYGFYDKKHKEANIILEEGLTIYPQNMDILDNYTKNLLMVGDDSVAYKYIIQGLSINPMHDGLLENLGEINARQGNFTQANMAFYLSLYAKFQIKRFSSKTVNLLRKLEGTSVGSYEQKNFPFNWDGEETSLKDYEKIEAVKSLNPSFRIKNYFSATDDVLSNKMGLDARYKSRIDLNWKFAKQGQIMVESLEKEKKPKQTDADYTIYQHYLANILIAMHKDVKYMKPFQFSILGVINNEEGNKYHASSKGLAEVSASRVKIITKLSELDEEIRIKDKASIYPSQRRFRANDLLFFATGNLIDNTNEHIKSNRNGFWQLYNINNNVVTTLNYSDGKREGDYTNLNPEGKIIERGLYSKDVLISNTDYEENGMIISKFNFDKKENLVDSNYTFNPDGSPIMVYYYNSNPKKVSFQKEYFQNGTIYTQGELIGKAKKGPYTYYTKHGVKTFESTFKDNQQDGITTDYYNNGKIAETGKYKAGDKVGKWIEYDMKGNVTNETNYAKGLLEGPSLAYENSILIKSSNFKKDNFDGLQKSFKNGKVATEEVYKAGALVSYKNFDENGKVIYSLEDINTKKTVELKAKYPDGKLYISGKLAMGISTEEWKYYDEQGALYKSVMYDKGLYDGKTVFYHSNGLKSAEYYYDKGRLTGDYIAYHESGKKNQSGKYKNGDKVGEWLYYFMNGTLKSKSFYKNDKIEGLQHWYTCAGGLEYTTYIKKGWNYYRVSYDSLEKAIDTSHFVNPLGKIYYELNILGDTIFKTNFIHNEAIGKGLGYAGKTVVLELNYMAGDIDGKLIRRDALGKLLEENEYEKGNFVSQIMYHQQNGVKQYECKFEDNERNGVSTFYYPNGNFQVKSTHANGALNGLQFRYAPDGNLVYVADYKDGKIVRIGESENALQQINKEVQKFNFKNLDGSNKSIFSISYGTLDSNWQIFYKSGKLAQVRFYENNEINGSDTTFYENGSIHEIESYNFGVRDGSNICYDEKNNLVFSKQYKNDILHGTVILLDSADNKLKTFYYYNNNLIHTKL